MSLASTVGKAMTDSCGTRGVEWMEANALEKALRPLLEHYDVKDRGHGLIYVDHQQYNIVTAHRILGDLSALLGVPAPLIRNRLIELGWFNDARSALSVRESVVRVVDRLQPWTGYWSDIEDFEVEEGADWD